MNLEEQLLYEHSKRNTQFIVSYIEDDPDKFRDLMNLFFVGSYRVVQRAAWVMSECVHQNPGLIDNYWEKLIKNLEKKDVHDAVKRNTLKMLGNIEIPVRYYGALIAICFDLLIDRKEPIAIKAFSMCVLVELIKDEPDLKKELRIVIEDQLPFSSPGFRSRGLKTLQQLANNR